MKAHRVFGLLVAVVVCLCPVGWAQQAPFQYAVKFVCGQGEGRVVAAGAYFTAINVHNPTEEDVRFREKFAVALPGEQPGPVSEFFGAGLGPGEAFEIDCPDITERAQFEGDFVKGFVVIQTEVELDIVAVYTAAGATERVESVHIEQIAPRRSGSGGCPDLIVERVDRPEWDGVNRRSMIAATIKNVGDAAAAPTLARVVDPTTPQPSGAPYNDVVNTPALAPGDSAPVVFHLPYWVYNPDATLEIAADYKNILPECREDNNQEVFEELG